MAYHIRGDVTVTLTINVNIEANDLEGVNDRIEHEAIRVVNAALAAKRTPAMYFDRADVDEHSIKVTKDEAN